MTNFPAALDTLINLPDPGANDVMANANAQLDHAYQHDTVNSAIRALEAKVGIDGSADTNSLDNRISSTGILLVTVLPAPSAAIHGKLYLLLRKASTNTAFDYAPAPSDAGGSAGIANWNDTSFPANVTGTFLHSGSWTDTVLVSSAGNYAIYGDFPTNSNIGDISLTFNGVTGPVVHNTSASPGANLQAFLGTFTLPSGTISLLFNFLSLNYAACKTLHFLPLGSTDILYICTQQGDASYLMQKVSLI